MIHKLWHFPKNKIFWSFLISYIIIIGFGIVVVTLIYFCSVRIIKDEIRTTSCDAVDQAKQIIDVRQLEISKLGFELFYNSHILAYSNAGSKLSNDDRYNSYQVISDLHAYCNSNRFISDCYLYFKDSDTIVSTQSRYTPDFYYNYVSPFRNLSYQEWYTSILTSYNSDRYIPASPVVVDGNSENMIMYVQSLPYQDKDSWFMNMVVMINENNVKSVLSNITNKNNGDSYIITPSNQVITSVSRDGQLADLTYDELKGDNGFFIKKVRNASVAVTYTTSATSKWKYVSAVPLNIYLDKMYRLRSIAIVGTLVFLTLMLLASVRFAYRDFAPMKKIFNLITSVRKNTEGSAQIEQNYVTLQSLVGKVVDENKSFKSQVPVLQLSLLSSLIRGEIKDDSVLCECIRLLDIHFSLPLFGLILMLVEDDNPAVSLGEITVEIEDIIKKEVIPDFNSYTVLLGNKQLAVLCNFDFIAADDGERRMELMAVKITEKMKLRKVSLSSAVSGVCRGSCNISECYRQSLTAMDFRLIKGKNAVIKYKEELAQYSNKDYYYPVKDENYIANLVSAGELKKVDLLMNEIYQKNFVERQLSPFVVRCLMYDMINITLRCLHEIKSDDIFPFSNDFDPIEQLSRCDTIEELFDKIKKILSTLCKSVELNKKSHNTNLKNDVMKYIDEHYQNHDLCLELLADRFKLSSAYLSRFFKEQTGICFSDYLNKIRLDGATVYLNGGSSLSICTIAEKVGYNNVNSFIRAFKKYKCVTPGKYKDNQRSTAIMS